MKSYPPQQLKLESKHDQGMDVCPSPHFNKDGHHQHRNQLMAAQLKEMHVPGGSCQAVASHRDPALLTRNASSTTVCFAVSDVCSAGKNKMG